jgi:hypothetical protein
MDGLGIERSEVDKAIAKGMKWKEKNTEKWHANMSGVECVFLKEEDTIFVITVYMCGEEK